MIPSVLAGTPYGDTVYVCVALAAFCWVLSLLTDDYSWVDRLWSVVPAVFCVMVAADLGFGSARVNLMSMLVTIWAIRLTSNLAMKGGYRLSGEDYRWIYIRERFGRFTFQLLNFVFIAFGQMAIIWLFTSPIHQAWVHSERPLRWLDYLATAVFLMFLSLESTADAQMWRFQQTKKRRLADGIEVEHFMDRGLFRFSRHPNYFSEMGLWTVFYAFAISASNELWHWTGLGFPLLILLFQGSTTLTEKISSEKYPTYSSYQTAVPRLVPLGFLPKRRKSRTAESLTRGRQATDPRGL